MLASLFVSAVALASVNTPEIDRVRERQNMLELADNLPRTNLVVNVTTNHPASQFVEFFEAKIWPRLDELKRQENLFELWMVALDRALYNDEAEEKLWIEKRVAARNRLNEISADPRWKTDVLYWAEMAQGLNGELADFARHLGKQIQVESYSAESLPFLKELEGVMAEITTIANKSPYTKGLNQSEAEALETVSRYYAGEITFDQAWQKIESLMPTGKLALGQDIAKTAAPLLNRAAILRTKIAKLNGANTWAELVLSHQSDGYSEGFKTVDEKVRFLEGILKATREPYREYLRKSLSVVKSEAVEPDSLKGLRRSMLSLLGNEGSTLIKDYFPLERLEDIWKKTMLESGVSQQELDQVNLDVYARTGKQTHAYMANLSSSKPRTLTIGDDLRVYGTTEDWQLARIFIVQNFRTDGPNYLSTAFHEGGHALDYIFRRNPIPTREALESSNSYSELHSTLMEYFLEDKQFLLANGETRDGRRIPENLVDQYISNMKIDALIHLRHMAAGALYDIELWNHSYREDTIPFVTQARRLTRTIQEDNLQVPLEALNGVDPTFSHFSTNHFYSGEVRYIGYLLAAMGAQLSADHLLDILEEQTGRRTLYRQPSMVPLLKRRYYASGFRLPYPRPVEEFTQASFSPEALVRSAMDAVKDYHPKPVGSCEGNLEGEQK